MICVYNLYLMTWRAIIVWAVVCAEVSCAQMISFADVTETAGLVRPLTGIMGHGGAWGDYDGDGHLDLYVGGFCDRPNAQYRPAGGPVANCLLRNLGDGRFKPVMAPQV